MASFTAQAALRAKWSSLVEDHSIEVPVEVTNKVTSVVGWLKQVYSFKLCVHLHDSLFFISEGMYIKICLLLCMYALLYCSKYCKITYS